jgi:hypothetical protein
MHRSLVLSAFLVLLLSGCITMEYEQKVERDGSSVIKQKIDLSALLAMGNETGPDPFENICINITKGETDISCTYEKGVVSVAKSYRAADGVYTFTKSSEFPYITYTLEIRKLPQIGQSGGEGAGQMGGGDQLGSDFKSPDSRPAAASMKAIGAKITYTVYMPGEVISAENGKIVEGKAEYDVLDLMDDGEYIVVKSRELDVLMLVGSAVVLLAALAVMGFVVLKLKK